MNKNDGLPVTGAQLLADFQSTMFNLVTAEVSAHEAKKSEELAIGQLNYFGGDGVLNPRLIPSDSTDSISRASVDAHIKKVQAEQIKHLSRTQLTEMTQRNQKLYSGKRVEVHVIEAKQKPIESLWFDKYKGYSNGILKTKKIKGIIKEVLLEKNALLLKPSLLSRIINPKRKYYVVYAVSPDSLQPMVEFKIK